MEKIKRGLMAMLFLSLLAVPLAAYANHGGGHCKMGGGCGKGYGHSEKGSCPITNKFFWQAHEMLEHKKELGLSEEQVAAVKGLKLEVKKQTVQNMANAQLFMIDLESKLHDDKLDTEGINAMIDASMSSMATSAKQMVDNYAKLKAILTAEQLAKMKTVR